MPKILKNKIEAFFEFFKRKERYIYLEYGVFTFILIWPLLKRGFVFALDLNWPVILNWPTEYNHLYLFNIVLSLLNKLIPSDIIEKLVLFGIVFVALVSMHKFIPTKNSWPKYFAAIFYVVNPYFYDRLVYGQIYQLAAYALLPLALTFTLSTVREQTYRNLAKLTIVLSLMAIFSYHLILIILLPIYLYVTATIIRKSISRENPIRLILFFYIALPLFFSLVNFYWLIPINGTNIDFQTLGSISTEAKTTYETLSGGRNIFINVLSLHGFWGEGTGLFYVVKDYYPFNSVAVLIIALMAIGGVYIELKSKKNLAFNLSLISSAFIALILGIGIAVKAFIPLISFLENSFPFYKGFREPQKFVALLVCFYAYFSAFALNLILQKTGEKKREILSGLFIVFILFSNTYIYNGANGQLFTSKYPPSWYQAKSIIDTGLNQNEKILFLPWHQYMSYSFTKNKIVGNLGCTFFGSNAICGDNEEISNIYSTSQREFSTFFSSEVIGKLATSSKPDFTGLAMDLSRKFQIKYILLAKETDWQYYSFLDQNKELKIIFSSPEITLYAIETFK